MKWAEINDIASSNHAEKELFYFMRAGNSFSNQYCPMFWMGDQMVDWGENDGLKSTVTALNSAAMSGIRNLHSDIGGYTTVKNGFVQVVRDRELFFRWAELNIFQPFYRTHEGVMPEANHQFYSDDSTMRFFARMGKIHFALKPYRQQYEERLSPVPMIHPMLIDYPDDSVCYDLKYQFMYGKELIVAPVLDKGATNVNTYLPKGNWIELFSGKEYKGSLWHIVPAPFGKPPTFIKVDSGWRTYFEDLFSVYK
jgi:alpha-glucosidase